MSEPDPKLCFVISQIGSEDSPEREQADEAFLLIERAVSQYNFEVVRADMVPDPGMITRSIMDMIKRADLVIADLTGANPNVYYELAARHAIRKPTIQVALKGTKLPFDIAFIKTIEYDTSSMSAGLKSIERISSVVKHVIDNPVSISNPVSDIIDGISGSSCELSSVCDQTWIAELFGRKSGITLCGTALDKYCGEYISYRYSPWAMSSRRYKKPILARHNVIENNGKNLSMTETGADEDAYFGNIIAMQDEMFCILSTTDISSFSPILLFKSTLPQVDVIYGIDAYMSSGGGKVICRPLVLVRINSGDSCNRSGGAFDLNEIPEDVAELLISAPTDEMKMIFEHNGINVAMSYLCIPRNPE
ncbi:MAG: nucleoside 2-deoxyribosyltransferase [Magnetospirillum sp. WYHS-4]